MLRPLAFDYASDANVLDMKNQFMFGKNMLVAPVTTPMYYAPDSKPLDGVEKTRGVYLPTGKTWYDFYTNQSYAGGQTITADAPLERIPVFVPSGSIIPMCMGNIEYSAQYADVPWNIRVYPGADAVFTVYQDAGDGYAYEKGERSQFSFLWNDKKQTLTITSREGKYVPAKAIDMTVTLADGRKAHVVYDGTKKIVKLK